MTDENHGRLLVEARDFVFLYVTFPDAEIAQRVALGALERRFCACANIWPPHVSIYRWKDGIETTSEVGVLFKTTRLKNDELAEFVRAEHPYETPCIAALAIDQIEPAFGAWIKSAT